MDWIDGTWLGLYIAEFLLRFLITGAVALPLSALLRRWLPRIWRRPSYRRPEPYETAMLAGGYLRVCQAVLAHLREEDRLELIGGSIQLPEDDDGPEPAPPEDAIERVAMEAARRDTSSVRFREIMEKKTLGLRIGLIEKGYWLDRSKALIVRAAALFPALAWWLLGLLKVIIDFGTEEPVGHVGVVLFLATMPILAIALGEIRTPEARRYLRSERKRYQRDFSVLEKTDPGALRMAVALGGPDTDDPLAPLFASVWQKRSFDPHGEL